MACKLSSRMECVKMLDQTQEWARMNFDCEMITGVDGLFKYGRKCSCPFHTQQSLESGDTPTQTRC